MQTSVPVRCLPIVVTRFVTRIEEGVGEAWQTILSTTSNSVGQFKERRGLKRHSDEDIGNGLNFRRMTSYITAQNERSVLDFRVLEPTTTDVIEKKGVVSRAAVSPNRDCSKKTGSDEVVSENRPTDAMWPVGSEIYV